MPEQILIWQVLWIIDDIALFGCVYPCHVSTECASPGLRWIDSSLISAPSNACMPLLWDKVTIVLLTGAGRRGRAPEYLPSVTITARSTPFLCMLAPCSLCAEHDLTTDSGQILCQSNNTCINLGYIDTRTCMMMSYVHVYAHARALLVHPEGHALYMYKHAPFSSSTQLHFQSWVDS